MVIGLVLWAVSFSLLIIGAVAFAVRYNKLLENISKYNVMVSVHANFLIHFMQELSVLYFGY